MKRNNGNSQNGTPLSKHRGGTETCRRVLLTLTVLTLAAGTAYGQTNSPWGDIATKFGQVFAGPVAKGLALTSIVVGGLEIAFGSGHSARTIGGLIFGLGLALGAASFIAWIIT